MPKSDRPAFVSERALCEAFLSAAAIPDGWTAYPETDGWDILLVRDFVQIGLQAKLRPSMEVLAQAADPLRSRRASQGPHYIAVLAPWTTGPFAVVADALGLVVLSPRTCAGGIKWRSLTEAIQGRAPFHFEEPAWLPPVIPDVPAGVPSPVQLTEWKIRALRFVARLEVRGYVTVHDLREFGMSSSLWYNRWLVQVDGVYSGPPRWVRRAGIRLVDEQHPGVFAGFVAEARASGVPPVPAPQVRKRGIGQPNQLNLNS